MRIYKNQKGLASIVVVFVLVVVLSLISIGFTKLIERGSQSSVNSQLAAAATAAAQSGITDVTNYLKVNEAPANSDTKCDALKTVIPSGANLGTNTSYTCLLADKTPTSLQYQNLPPNKSQIVKLKGTSAITSLLVSWSAFNRSSNKAVPSGESTKLFDQTYWASQSYMPLLKVSLFPIFAGDNNLSATVGKSFYLYPQDVSSSFKVVHYNGSDSQPISVNCANKNQPASFGSSDNYDCNMVIDNLPNNSNSVYAQITPVYGQANVQLKANNSSNAVVEFQSVQALVDVTANSGGASKRLQARVDISSGNTSVNAADDAAPTDALRSAGAICKRLVVSATDVTVDSSVTSDCGTAVNEGSTVPVVSLTVNGASSITVPPGTTINRAWSSTNAASCSASASPANSNWTGAKALSGADTASYTVTTNLSLTCTGPGGSAPATATVTVLPTTAAPSGYLHVNGATSTTVSSGAQVTRSWHVINATTCTPGSSPADGDWKASSPVIPSAGAPLPDGSWSNGAHSSNRTITLLCAGPGGSTTFTATINVIQRPTVNLYVCRKGKTCNNSTVTVNKGNSVNRIWNVANATSCSALSSPTDGDWGPSTSISLPTGSRDRGSYNRKTTLYLTCTGPGGTTQATATVKIESGGGGGGGGGGGPPPPGGGGGGSSAPVCHTWSVNQNGNWSADVWGDCDSTADTVNYYGTFWCGYRGGPYPDYNGPSSSSTFNYSHHISGRVVFQGQVVGIKNGVWGYGEYKDTSWSAFGGTTSC